MKAIGKFFKRFFGFICVIETFLGIYLFFTVESSAKIPALITTAIFILLAYLCLKKPKEKLTDIQNTSASPEPIINLDIPISNAVPLCATQASVRMHPNETPSFYEMKIVPNTIPPMENYYVLNDDEQKFFRYFHDELVKNKFHPEHIKLSRLSNGCFNVDYIGLCYIGKINLFQPPITYSVKKEGNKRATKHFPSLSDAEEFIRGKDGYSVIPNQEKHSYFIQYTQGSREAKSVYATSVEECITYIPYWIRYLKYCKRN